MITLEKVSAGIGRVQILRDVDIRVEPGKLVLVLGANGAGKTTLLRVISGVVPLWSGKLLFGSDSIAGRPAHELARLGLVHVPQGRQIIPTLSVEENLVIGAAHLPGITKDTIVRRLEQEYARFPVLEDPPQPCRRLAFGRRAADAGGVARFDDGPEVAHAR